MAVNLDLCKDAIYNTQMDLPDTFFGIFCLVGLGVRHVF